LLFFFEKKYTRVPDFDQYYDTAEKPLIDIVSWNNGLDDALSKFRKLGADIRKLSKADAPDALGHTKLVVVAGQIQVSIAHKDENVPESKLDKVALERFNLVKKKVVLVNKRILTLQKRAGFEQATLKVGEKDKSSIELVANKDELKKQKEEDDVVDMERSITKLNNRIGLLDVQLGGNVTLAQCVSALINSLKDELKKRGEKLKLKIEDGMPEISGLPSSPEEFLPELVARAYNLFWQIIDYLKKVTKQMPQLLSQIESLIKESAEFPGKLPDAAKSANLGFVEVAKATKAIGANSKTLAAAPAMAKTLASVVKDTTLEIVGVFSSLPKEDEDEQKS